MKKPTLCKAPQKCEDCRAYVPIDDTRNTEGGIDEDYHMECAFKHYKWGNQNEMECYEHWFKKYKEQLNGKSDNDL